MYWHVHAYSYRHTELHITHKHIKIYEKEREEDGERK